MIHIFGHSWFVRWGKPDEEKMVKVFSNCGDVELFLNGVSAGVKHRNLANYPAAGLHWTVKFKEGTNILRAIGRNGRIEVGDEIQQAYRTKTWGKPASLTFMQVTQSNDVTVVETHAFDKDGVPCLDAVNLVRFGLTGDGQLLDNLGTSSGSRVVQLYNGRAQISLRLNGSKAVASVVSDGLPTQFLTVTKTDLIATKLRRMPRSTLNRKPSPSITPN